MSARPNPYQDCWKVTKKAASPAWSELNSFRSNILHHFSISLIKQTHLIECSETQQSQDQTGRLIIPQENPGSSSLCSPAQEGRSQSPKGSVGPLHCTHLQSWPTALEHGTISFTVESGPSNLCCFFSAGSVGVELSCGQTWVPVQQLVGQELRESQAQSPLLACPPVLGHAQTHLYCPGICTGLCKQTNIVLPQNHWIAVYSSNQCVFNAEVPWQYREMPSET